MLAAESIDAPAGTDRAAAELTVAPALLNRCRQVLAAGGDSLLAVTANQPALLEAVQVLFDPPPTVAGLPRRDRRTIATLDDGHGRTRERRVLTASTDLAGYLAWPGHAQVLRIERTWREHDRAKRAVRSAITSLTPERADAARRLARNRGHWGNENGLHRAKDVNLGEDASLVHVGQGPTVLALLRDPAVSLLHLAGVTAIASRLRRHSQHPESAVALVINPLSPHA